MNKYLKTALISSAILFMAIQSNVYGYRGGEERGGERGGEERGGEERGGERGGYGGEHRDYQQGGYHGEAGRYGDQYHGAVPIPVGGYNNNQQPVYVNPNPEPQSIQNYYNNPPPLTGPQK